MLELPLKRLILRWSLLVCCLILRPRRCHNRWNQFFNFGNGELAGHLESTVPGHLVMAKELNTGTLCLEVGKKNGIR